MNLAQVLELVAKYAPVIVGIIQREGPAIEAFLQDLQALQAGQKPNAVVPAASFAAKDGQTNLAAPKGPF